MSDILGVPNLRMRSKELVTYYFNKIRKKNIQQSKPYLLLMNKKEKTFMIIYSMIVNLFFAFYFCYIMPLFLYNFFKTYPALVKEVFINIAIGVSPSFQSIQLILGQTVFFALTVFILIRTFLPLIKNTFRKRR